MEIVFASNNAHKLAEVSSKLPENFKILSLKDVLGDVDIPETGQTLDDNAIIKAKYVFERTGKNCFADDTGLEITALNGEPGVYSARYAGTSGSQADRDNNAKLLAELESIAEPQRAARFQCVIVYLRHENDPMPLICQGTWEGRILFSASGGNGFGYDPLFYVPTHDCASAELDAEVKNAISHRGQALRQLLQCWNSHR